jgi:hypothetical protein
MKTLLRHIPEAINIPSLEELPDTTEQHFSIPAPALIPVIRQLKYAGTKVEEEYRKHLPVLESIYNILGDDQPKSMSLEEVADKLDLPVNPTGQQHEAKRSAYLMYALHRSLTRADLDSIKINQYMHRTFNRFDFAPKEIVARRKRVYQWIRTYQGLISTSSILSRGTEVGRARAALKQSPITKFADKVPGLIERARSSRDDMQGFIGPYHGPLGETITWNLKSPEERSLVTEETYIKTVSSTVFSSTDRDIIETLLDWSVYLDLVKDGPMSALGPFLLKATAMDQSKEVDLNIGSAYTLLRKIGVLSPWHVRLTGHEGPYPLLDRILNPSLTRSDLNEDAPTTGPLEDAMADLREPMSCQNGTVFCVDSQATKAVDDGISLERIPGDSAVWVHIYIADPCAFLSSDHPLAKRARDKSATMYLPNATNLMLPNDLVTNKLGLDAGRPALRFSGKLNENGQILERKITPVTLNDIVIRIDPEMANDLLDLPKVVTPGYPLIIGPQPPFDDQHTESAQLSDSQLEELKALQRFGDAYFQRRLTRGLISVYERKSKFFISNGDALQLGRDLTSLDKALLYIGDPSIYYQGAEADREEPISQTLFVHQFTSMACEMAGEWTSSRNIKTAYRGNLAGSTAEDRDHYYREVVKPLWDSLGYFPTEFARQHQKVCGENGLSSVPVPWELLGANVYSKSTSPLRRYEDMIVHWQIEAALRREAITGRQFDGNDPEDLKSLPFIGNDLEQALVEVTAKQHMLARATRKFEGHWRLQAIARAFHFNECKLPEAFEFIVYTPVLHIYKPMVIGRLVEINMTAYMDLEDGRGIHAGDRFECRIISVLEDRGVRIEMIRPIRKAKHRQNVSQIDVDLIANSYSVTPEVQAAVRNLSQVYSEHRPAQLS